MYTVKQLADMAGVSRRTLHYYDEIGLLRPFTTTSTGYRQYNDDALFRLQQILFFREIGLDLKQIRGILDDPDFDLISALQSHRQTMQDKMKRLETLIQTVDTTIMHLIGEVEMSKKNIFEGFSDEKQKQYEQEAVENWGDTAAESIKLWNSYSDERKAEIMEEGNVIYREIAGQHGQRRRQSRNPRIAGALASAYALFL